LKRSMQLSFEHLTLFMNNRVGSPIYVAPEILVSGRYTSKIDSYSFGICLVACLRSEENIAKFFFQGLRRYLKKKDLQGERAKRVN